MQSLREIQIYGFSYRMIITLNVIWECRSLKRHESDCIVNCVSQGDDPKIVSHYGVLMCLILWDIRFQSATIKVRILRKDLETLDFTVFFEKDKLRTVLCRLINIGLHKILRIKFESATSLHQIRIKILLWINASISILFLFTFLLIHQINPKLCINKTFIFIKVSGI